jgi:DNA-nicking Smr family endonuclease
MPTVFGSISDGFYTAFFEPDPDKRKERIQAWIKESAPVIQAAVEDELKDYLDELLDGTWTERGWISRARKFYGEYRTSVVKKDTKTIPFIDAYQLQLSLKILRSDAKDIHRRVGETTPEIRDKTIEAIEKAKTETAKLEPPTPVQIRETDLHEYATVEGAIASVGKFLKDSFRDNVRRVRIIHGMGEGVLREAVRECLDEHPFVVSISISSADAKHGGEGATEANLVTLKAELLDWMQNTASGEYG